jgi:hypothetical protein
LIVQKMRSWKRMMQLTDRVDWKYYACFEISKTTEN